MIDQQRPTMRYSPRPISGYVTRIGDATWGPAQSRLLKRPGAWNLAYLSHDYDKTPQPADPNFTVHVFYSIKYDWVKNVVDLGDASPFEHTIACKLTLPAPAFVKWLHDNPSIHHGIPLFQAYGQAWLETVTERSFGCHDYDYEPDLEVRDISSASALLQPYRAR